MALPAASFELDAHRRRNSPNHAPATNFRHILRRLPPLVHAACLSVRLVEVTGTPPFHDRSCGGTSA